MSRLKFKEGDLVTVNGSEHHFVVSQAQPALQDPYLLSNSVWYPEEALTLYVPPEPTWEQLEGHIKMLVNQLRNKFSDNEEHYMSLKITAGGRVDGNIKITYRIGDASYEMATDVQGYSIRPTLEEFERRKKWQERNAPELLTNSGETKIDDVI